MKHVCIIGSGPMAIDYINVLKSLESSFSVIGRSEQSAIECSNKTGCEVRSGGIEQYLKKKSNKCSHAIVAVGVENLSEVTITLLEHGIQNILIEKPAGLNSKEIEKLNFITQEKQANLFVAYNRRFYSSVKKLQELIKQDGGVTSFNFEFTEWAHVIEPLNKPKAVKSQWFLANSTHVVDLAFFLGGKPKEISSYISGNLSWHPSGSIFSGAGISDKGALFSYQANWESAGRWSVEILTNKHRLILRPMEKLQIQEKGVISQSFVEIDETLDIEYKPGLFKQTEAFLNGSYENLCSINEQCKTMEIYNKIANYRHC